MKVLLYMCIVFLELITQLVYAEESFYCPQRHAYIHVGMTPTQVMDACGAPMFKKNSDSAVIQRTPVTQLFYTNLNRGAIFQGYDMIYNTWSLPNGSAQGSSIQIDFVDRKVSALVLNNSSVNVITICGGKPIQKGDSIDSVFAACGSPSMMNESFISTPVSSESKPEVWIYELDEYQSPLNLTFVNGILQSIYQ